MGRRHKFYDSDIFKTLQQEWYQRLRDEGFKDAEKLVGSELRLSQSTLHPYRHSNYISAQAKLEYYLMMSRCLDLEEFDKKRDHLVMSMRSIGYRIVEIRKVLKLYGYKAHRQTIRFIIRRFEKKWKIRDWQNHQLTSNMQPTA